MTDIKIMCAYDKMVDVVELVPNPRNPNKHPEKQIILLAKLIEKQGFRKPIVVSNRSGFMTSGHGGILSGAYPHWDMVSCGPTLMSPHSPDERANIPSVAKCWEFLKAVLENIPVK